MSGWRWALLALIVAAGIAVSIGLAKLGEPQSVWFWGWLL